VTREAPAQIVYIHWFHALILDEPPTEINPLGIETR